MKKLVFLMVMVGMVACGKEFLEVEALRANVGIVGTWIEEAYMGDTILLKRAGELDEHKYGFVLKQDGTFIERKNSGWCGTPPILMPTLRVPLKLYPTAFSTSPWVIGAG